MTDALPIPAKDHDNADGRYHGKCVTLTTISAAAVTMTEVLGNRFCHGTFLATLTSKARKAASGTSSDDVQSDSGDGGQVN